MRERFEIAMDIFQVFNLKASCYTFALFPMTFQNIIIRLAAGLPVNGESS